MLEELYINNYRNFSNCTVSFNKGFTLLCGKNGSGKTTVIEVIYKLISFIGDGYRVSAVACRDDCPRWLAAGYGTFETEFRLKYNIEGYTFKYGLIVQHNLKDRICRIKSETLTYNGNMAYELALVEETQVTVFTDDGKDVRYPADWSFSGLSLASAKNSKIRLFLKYCGQFNVLGLDRDGIFNTGKENKYGLAESNFEKWYLADSQNHLNVISSIIDSYKGFISGLNNVRKSNNDNIVFVFDNNGAEYEISYSELSSGQKKMCMYYYILYTLKNGSLVIMDEVENHLSPSELNPIYNLMLDVADEKDVQFILVSHNPKLLNWYQNDAFLLTTKGLPAIVHTEKLNPEESEISIYRMLEDQ